MSSLRLQSAPVSTSPRETRSRSQNGRARSRIRSSSLAPASCQQRLLRRFPVAAEGNVIPDGIDDTFGTDGHNPGADIVSVTIDGDSPAKTVGNSPDRRVARIRSGHRLDADDRPWSRRSHAPNPDGKQLQLRRPRQSTASASPASSCRQYWWRYFFYASKSRTTREIRSKLNLRLIFC